jgi:hypothetical protein
VQLLQSSVENVSANAGGMYVTARIFVAWALLFPPPMITNTRNWRRLTPETIADVPETGAVFEVANLVRTVQFIGAASGNLRARLAAYAQEDLKVRPIPGGYYFRYVPATAEDEALNEELSSYRSRHGGLLPIGNSEAVLPRLRVASRHAA